MVRRYGGRDAPTLADGDGARDFPEPELADVERVDDGVVLHWRSENWPTELVVVAGQLGDGLAEALFEQFAGFLFERDDLLVRLALRVVDSAVNPLGHAEHRDVADDLRVRLVR